MSTTVLTVTNSTVLDNNGNGTIILRPDVNQNWAPLFVRVSTGSRNSPVAYCAVYHGAPGVPVQQSQFIDDTFLGNGDTSSIISGTPILFGEAVTFVFSGGSPKDTAIATVYGMQSDVPPNLGINPQVPGTHFTGHLSTEVITQLAIQQFNLTPGHTTPPASSNSTIFDVRQYGSYFLDAAGAYANGPGGIQDSFIIQMIWYADAAGVSMVYQDYAEAQAQTAQNQVSDLYVQDAMHGPYMRVIISNPNSDFTNLGYRLFASTRNIIQPYFRQQAAPGVGNGTDGVLVNQVNVPIIASGSQIIPLPFAYGRTFVKFFNHGPASSIAFTFALQSVVPAPAAIQVYFAAANAGSSGEIVLPKRAVAITVLNQDGANAGSYDIHVGTQFDKV